MNIWKAFSIGERQTGHVWQSCTIVSLQFPQQCACLHGINIHVVSRDNKQTTHMFVVVILCANVLTEESSLSSELELLSFVSIKEPTVWLIALTYSNAVYLPSTRNSLYFCRRWSFCTFFFFLSLVIRKPSFNLPISLFVSNIISFNVQKIQYSWLATFY